jgi:hypothetical protein
MGSRFSRIAAPVLGLLAVMAAVGFVLAAPFLLDSSPEQTALPAPPSSTGEVASVVAPSLNTPQAGSGGAPSPSGATTPSLTAPALLGPNASSTLMAAPLPESGAQRPLPSARGGGISATAQPGVGARTVVSARPQHGHQGDRGHAGTKPGHHGDRGKHKGRGHHGHDATHANHAGRGHHTSHTHQGGPAHHALGFTHVRSTKPHRSSHSTAKHGHSHGRGRAHSRSRR